MSQITLQKLHHTLCHIYFYDNFHQCRTTLYTVAFRNKQHMKLELNQSHCLKYDPTLPVLRVDPFYDHRSVTTNVCSK